MEMDFLTLALSGAIGDTVLLLLKNHVFSLIKFLPFGYDIFKSL